MVIVLLATAVFARYAPHRPTAILGGTPAPALEKGAQWILSDIAMVSPNEGWAVGSLISDADQGIPPNSSGTYQPTMTPILLHYLDGKWSIFGG